MAGRGRGRGRGTGLSIPGDFGKDQSLPPILQPPPTFPPLEFKPYPMYVDEKGERTKEMRYMLNMKKIFADNMQESHNNVVPIVVRKDIERYSDKYQELLSIKQGYETRYDWSRMPAELNIQAKKRKGEKIKASAKKKLKEVDVEGKLKELEQKESAHKSDAEEDDKDEDETEDKDPDEIAEGEEEGVDEEMDEGTDYINNYFDNGENYEDDEENMDDGAIF